MKVILNIIEVLIVVTITLMSFNVNGNLLNEYSSRSAKFNCPESLSCSCAYVYGEYELNCPVANPSIVLRVNPLLRVQIDCSTSNEQDYMLLPEANIGDIPTVQITRCPLPKSQPIVSVLNRLGIQKIRGFFFSSYGANLGMSLIRQHLSGLNDLERLYLSGNGLTDVPVDLFNDVSNIKWLDLQRNKVHLPRDIFKNLQKLEYLELGYNNLEKFEPGVFRNQNKLTLLNLWGNAFKNLTKNAFEGLISLRELDLSGSSIEILNSDVLHHLKNLSNLNLSSNRLKTLPVQLLIENKQLERFRLQNNRVRMEKIPDRFFEKNKGILDITIQAGLDNVPSELFVGAIKLQNLSLAQNALTELPDGLFSDQKQLQHLDLSSNMLVELNNVFENTTNLVTLRLSDNQLLNISGTLFQHLLQLKELYMNNNKLYHINQNAFTSATSLEVIRLENNNISFMTTEKEQIDVFYDIGSPFQNLNQLRVLNLKNNSLTTIFRDWSLTALQLRELDLSFNNISIISFSDLQFISHNINVNLTNNQITEIDLRDLEMEAMFQDIEQEDPTEIKVYIEKNPINCNCVILNLVKYFLDELPKAAYKMITIIPGGLKCAEPANLIGREVKDLKLEELLCVLDSPGSSIKRCPKFCECNVRPIDYSMIVDCSNLNLTKVPVLPTINIHGLKSIELNLTNNNITELPLADTSGYSDVRKIYAKNNLIENIGVENLPNNLTLLEIDNNKLFYLNKTTISQLNRTSSLRSLSLSGNNWKCDCESLPFLLFTQNHYKVISDYQSIKCDNGESIAKLSPADFCPADHGILIATCVTLALFGLLTGVVAALYYTFNQEIKVWLYAHNLCLWFVTEEVLDKDKKYDAFISYSHKDEGFITDYLIPNLESSPNPFKLCLHARDWIIGEWIPTQIVKSVQDSRRTVVVLSPNFLESVWGRMEFRTAHSNALTEGRARVIVIIYGEIGNMSHLDPELKAYLNMNTYVKWGDPWFWDKLRYAMPHPASIKKPKTLLIKNGLKSSVDDKLELIIPSPSTPGLTTPPTDITGKNLLENNSNRSVNNSNDKLPNSNSINGNVNAAFIINTQSKQSDV